MHFRTVSSDKLFKMSLITLSFEIILTQYWNRLNLLNNEEHCNSFWFFQSISIWVAEANKNYPRHLVNDFDFWIWFFNFFFSNHRIYSVASRFKRINNPNTFFQSLHDFNLYSICIFTTISCSCSVINV